MRCSEFRDLHCAFVDDTLAGVELVRMHGHLNECNECAVLDTRVRRSLMVVRNLASIEPSADFGRRLELRLAQCRSEQQCPIGASFRTVAASVALASLLMLAYMAESLRTSGARAQDIVLPPVVALAIAPSHAASHAAAYATSQLAPRAPARFADTLTSAPAPAIVASASAGMPFWPAALLTEQAPLQLVSYTQAR